MYNKQLDTFAIVAQLGSFSKAAQALYITPSAVIQQINALEENLGVALFARNRRGVKLTRAGELLQNELPGIVSRNVALRKALGDTQNENHEIVVGIDLLCKCRLFYDYWQGYHKVNPRMRVRFVNISVARLATAEQTDLTESIYYDTTFSATRAFLPLQNIPIAVAMPRTHALAKRETLTIEDMRGETLITIATGQFKELDHLNADCRRSGIALEEVKLYDTAVFNRCMLDGCLMQTPAVWQDLHPELVTIPCDWDYTIPYGFYYRSESGSAAAGFIEYVKAQNGGTL